MNRPWPGETNRLVAREKISYKRTRIGRNCFIAGPSVIGVSIRRAQRLLVAAEGYPRSL